MHRYIQLGIHVKGFYSKKYERFQREITQVCEFYVDDEENLAKVNILYSRDLAGHETYNNPTSHLIDYLASQGVVMREDPFIPKGEEISESTEELNLDSNPVDNAASSNVPTSQTVVSPSTQAPNLSNTNNIVVNQPVVKSNNDTSGTQASNGLEIVEM
jgi:hypothetical protein